MFPISYISASVKTKVLTPCPREFPWDTFFSRLDAIPESERAGLLKDRGLVEREEKESFEAGILPDINTFKPPSS